MGYLSHIEACDFQMAMVPCPPEHLRVWYAGILAWWELVSQDIEPSAPCQVTPDIEISSSNKNLEVPKFTPKPCLGEGMQITSGRGEDCNVA